MCSEIKRPFFSFNVLMIIAVGLGLLSGWLHQPLLYEIAQAVSHVFMNLLKLISIPVIFFSLLSAISGMNLQEFQHVGKKVMKYTILTTFTAAVIALILFLIINPVQDAHIGFNQTDSAKAEQGYFSYLIQAIPSNIIKPFSESNVIGVMFLSLLFSLATLSLPTDVRKTLHGMFAALYALTMKVASWIVITIPIALWSFITLFVRDLREGMEFKQLALYLCCIVLANLIQGIISLPLFLKIQGISSWRLFRDMWPALSVAFFSKSSSATLPMAIQCAEERAGLSKKLTHFAFPLCTTMNMNGCAAFILITVLFVSMSHGISYSLMEMFLWTVIATVAALGNAGVPMGCYFLSGALLAAMNVPLNLLGVILPFYAFIDMLETALNVWSDTCVVAVVNAQVVEYYTPVLATSDEGSATSAATVN